VIKQERRRYLALNVLSGQPFGEREVLDAIQDSVLRLFGEYGASKADVKLIKRVPEKGQLVLRCSHFMLEKVRAAIASTVEMDGKAVAVYVVGTSGTLKALTKKI
jgi:RNase P/RNase MRP subunit POP5